MINTRLAYIEKPKRTLNVVQVLNEIDTLFDSSIYMQLMKDYFCLYSSGNENTVYVGYECLGREQSFYEHDEMKVLDFSIMNNESHKLEFENYEELFSKVNEKMIKINKSKFRIEIAYEEPGFCEVIYFD